MGGFSRFWWRSSRAWAGNRRAWRAGLAGRLALRGWLLREHWRRLDAWGR